MADYHIMSADKNANAFRVVFHLSVPNTLNDADVNYQTAIVEWQGGAENIASVLPGIGTELTQLQSGELYEVVDTFYSNPNETELQKQARLDAIWTSLQAEKQAELQSVLSYWGYSRVIP